MNGQSRKIFMQGLLVLLTCLAQLPAYTYPTSALASKPAKRILLLYSYQAVLPINLELDEAILVALKGPYDESQEFYTEYLDLAQFPDEAHRQRLVSFLRDKYVSRKIDLRMPGRHGVLPLLYVWPERGQAALAQYRQDFQSEWWRRIHPGNT